jgi:Tol biopolymer transport system component
MRLEKFRGLKLGTPTQLTYGLIDHEHPSVSPDGRLLAYYAGLYGAIGIVVTALDGRFGRSVSPHGGNNTQPAWKPGVVLWETALVGELEPRQLLADSRWHYKHPSYDPAGTRLAYFSDEGADGGAFHIWVWDLATGERKLVTFGDTHMHCHPVFSPDGTRIVFHAYEGTDESRVPPITNLCELDLESGEVTWLTRAADQYKHPFYIDDEVIVFHHERNSDGVRGIEAMHLESREVVALTDGICNDKHPFPFRNPDGELQLAWASKKLGDEPEGEPHNYDIFSAALEVGSEQSVDKEGKDRSKHKDKKSKGKKKDKGKKGKAKKA